MTRSWYSSGQYELVNDHDEKFMVYASETKARFLFKNHVKLGFKSVELIQTVHKMDFPKWSRILE